MDINSILDNLKYDILGNKKNKINLNENTFLLDLLNDDQFPQKRFRPFMNWKDFYGYTFPVTRYLSRVFLYIIECLIWLGYATIRGIRVLLLGKNRDKDMSTSPRVNFIIFFTIILTYIVIIVTLLVFFLKSVLLFNPQGGANNRGALVMPQDCGREHYTYLFNSATCWANTGIKVLKGDEIVISASGSFCGKISQMDNCARENKLPKFPRSIISYYNEDEDTLDDSIRELLIYNYKNNCRFCSILKSNCWFCSSQKNNARFGGLLMQIKEDYEDFEESCSNPNDMKLKQISFRGKKPTHVSVKKSGMLYFAVNDILLTDTVLTKLANNKVLQKTLDVENLIVAHDNKTDPINTDTLKEDTILKKFRPHIDPKLWFYDNVGEVLLNITIIRGDLPRNTFMPTFIVKTYRWLEDMCYNSTYWEWIELFTGVLLWILFDRMIGLQTRKRKIKKQT